MALSARPATANFRIVDYQVFLASHITVRGTSAKVAAYVVCRGRAGERLHLYFRRDDSDALFNTVEPDLREGTVFVPVQDFPWYIDVLRNEEPVYAYLNHGEPAWNRIYTGPEAVGDGEAAHVAPQAPAKAAPKPAGPTRIRA